MAFQERTSHPDLPVGLPNVLGKPLGAEASNEASRPPASKVVMENFQFWVSTEKVAETFLWLPKRGQATQTCLLASQTSSVSHLPLRPQTRPRGLRPRR